MQALLKERGVRNINFYGLTETMPCIVTLSSLYYGDDAHSVPGSTGQPNREFGEARIVDVVTGAPVSEPGVIGEIVFRGDVLTPGYYNDQERTRQAFDQDGWFHTGDLGYFDAGGNYFVVGRKDDMILSGAEKLSLLEVEDALRDHDRVRDIACIGVAHDRFGESPAAFVVWDGVDDEEAIRAELERHILTKLERWKRPRLYIRVSEIPRTGAKRTKDHQRLKAMVAGIVLSGNGSTTLTAWRQTHDRDLAPSG
jgi:acyl-CoA synthetase (AMP-forming)/AMP-acid ligase II